MRISNGAGRFALALLAAWTLAALSCEADDRKKRFGDLCTDGGDCETDVCFDGTCARWGAACTPGQESVTCDDSDPCSIDECDPSGKCLHKVDSVEPGCAPHSGVASCRCTDAGVTIDPGTCTWEDAARCSGWHSVAQENGNTDATEFPSGTTLCAFDCCLTIRCP